MLFKILIWILGGIAIALYTFFQIRKTIKWRKVFKEEMSKDGMTIEQAKKTANELVYKKKKKSKKAKQETNDVIYEE